MRAAAIPALVAAIALATLARADETTPLPDAKARPDSIVFARIPWRSPVEAAARRLEAEGFHETRAARTKDRLAADGRLFDAYALVQARLDYQGRVVRWEITLPSKGERNEYSVQRKIYDDAVAEMRAKCGRRQQSVEKFRFPYVKGDDNEARGVRQGYVTIRSAWSSKGGDHLQVEIQDDMSVALSYESRWWRQVENERRHRKAKDL